MLSTMRLHGCIILNYPNLQRELADGAYFLITSLRTAI